MSLPSVPCTIEYDDPEGDGFIALVDAPAYVGFIGDWELDTICELFTERSRDGVLAIQYVGQARCWVTMDVRSEASDRPATEEVSLPITITGGQLWATSYVDLTMVAQFAHSTLTTELSTTPILALDNGSYILTFRWLPFHESDEAAPYPVELVITPGTVEAPHPFPGAEELLR